MVNMYKSATDPSRCDWQRRNAPTANNTAAPPVATAAATVVAPLSAMPLQTLARRKPLNEFDAALARSSYCIEEYANYRLGVYDIDQARDMCGLQDAWERVIRTMQGTCSERFWKLFLDIHHFPGKLIDTVLSRVKKDFVLPESAEKKRFPTTRRLLFQRMEGLDELWTHITHVANIDLSGFDLPSGLQSIEFQFIDPVFAWLVAARKQKPADMHWRPAAQPPGQHLYGGGVQFGECFAHAYSTRPQGCGQNLLIRLHWDGTHGHGLQCCPIAVGVANTNKSDSSTEFCIGYQPVVPDMKLLNSDNATK